MKENVIVGRLVPAGTGLAYHTERRKKRAEDELAAQESVKDDAVMDKDSDSENEVIILAPTREELVEIARADQV